MPWIELQDYLSDIAMIESGFTDKMKRSLMGLQHFFNNKHGKCFNMEDIQQYIERNCEMNIRIGIENRMNGEGFEGGDEHKLNYAIKVVKQYYEDCNSEIERQKQKEFQEKVVKPSMSSMSDDEFLAMIQEEDVPENFFESNSQLPESESKGQNEDSNAIEAKSKNANGNVENDNELDARLEIIKNQVSEEFNKRLSELETGLSKQLLEIKCALPVVDEAQSTEDKPKRRGRPKKDVSAINTKKCLCCGKEKRVSEKGIESEFYKSHSRIHKGNDFFLPFCKECLEIQYFNIEFELQEAVKKAGIDVAEYYIKKRAVERICMMNDIYYDDSLFESALKHGCNNTMLSAYMKIVNLVQNKKKTYEDTFKERIKQEIMGMKQEQEVDLSWMEDAV